MSQEVYEKGVKYYPLLWSEKRIETLYAAGKLTKEERDAILNSKKEG